MDSRKKLKGLLALLSLGIIIPIAVWQYNELTAPKEVKALRWIARANAVSDAKAALTKNRHSLRGVYGLSLRIPHSGPDLPRNFLAQYGVDPIRGTTDGILSSEHSELIEKAAQYALAYNDYILAHYTPSPPPPPPPPPEAKQAPNQ